ncbi:hypothetical protein FALBO_12806 [Fusarium albosuccineum]|uniref:Ecp2 effector protein-like domain-containing protein n=1 Tax=Fusarium albosuccineum TaxID=1237068 RepID=A0A8H4PGV6_9HYPO|nr:hypothetical protein FALBO_12806 [Fusarium albosuccineum]
MRALAFTAALVGIAAAAPAPAPTATLFDDIVVVSTATSHTYEPTATPDASAYWTPNTTKQTTCDRKSYHAAFAPKDVKRADFRDCASLLSAFGRHNGTFSIPAVTDALPASYNASGFIDIVQSDSCTFGVRTAEALTLGDDDVDWIVQKTLKDYSAGFEMAARGKVDCATEKDAKKKAKLYWQVYDASTDQ